MLTPLLLALGSMQPAFSLRQHIQHEIEKNLSTCHGALSADFLQPLLDADNEAAHALAWRYHPVHRAKWKIAAVIGADHLSKIKLGKSLYWSTRPSKGSGGDAQLGAVLFMEYQADNAAWAAARRRSPNNMFLVWYSAGEADDKLPGGKLQLVAKRYASWIDLNISVYTGDGTLLVEEGTSISLPTSR